MGNDCIVLPDKQDDSDHQPIIGVVMNMYVYEFSSEKQRLNRKALVILLVGSPLSSSSLSPYSWYLQAFTHPNHLD